jgi:hypothetical protein
VRLTPACSRRDPRAADAERYTDTFDDPNLPGEMQTTITFKRASRGTELNAVQEGLPEAIPPDACYLGWQESLTLLAKLVEAEVPD